LNIPPFFPGGPFSRFPRPEPCSVSAPLILPGEMKYLMNKVTEAKMSAMRSQANTARLLPDQPDDHAPA